MSKAIKQPPPKIVKIKRRNLLFCGVCYDIIDQKRKAVFEALKAELKQPFPELSEDELFQAFESKFAAEFNDLVLFEHFTAVKARPQSCTTYGMRLGIRFDMLASAAGANGVDGIHSRHY